MHLVALHGGLQRADGVDLCDDDARAGGLHGGRTALADVTVARNERNLAAVIREGESAAGTTLLAAAAS